jgi:hypothetical protein
MGKYQDFCDISLEWITFDGTPVAHWHKQFKITSLTYLSFIFINNTVRITETILVHRKQVLCAVNADTYHTSNYNKIYNQVSWRYRINFGCIHRDWNNVPKVPDHGDQQSWLSLLFQVGNPAFLSIISNFLQIIDRWSAVISSPVLNAVSSSISSFSWFVVRRERRKQEKADLKTRTILVL